MEKDYLQLIGKQTRRLFNGRRRPAAWVCAAIVLAGLYWFASPGQAQAPPGSEADPLVTRSYLESYLAEHYGSSGSDVAELTARVNALERQVRELQQQLSQEPAGAAAGEIVLRVGSKTATVGGKAQTLDQAPLIEAGTVLVPFRFVGQAIGAGVGWDGSSKRITYLLGKTELVFQVGQPWVEVNGRRQELTVAPRLEGSTTMVPLRVVAEYLGAAVDWDKTSKTITIDL